MDICCSALYRTLLVEHPDDMPQEFCDIAQRRRAVDRAVCDYIAGMTDRFAVANVRGSVYPQIRGARYERRWFERI